MRRLGGNRIDFWPQQREPHEQRGIVVRGDSIWADFSTGQTFVDKHLLAIAADLAAGWRHAGHARRATVARPFQVDMSGVQTVWAMIAMSASGHRRADELVAFHAAKSLICLRSWRSIRFRVWPARAFASASVAIVIRGVLGCFGVVYGEWQRRTLWMRNASVTDRSVGVGRGCAGQPHSQGLW